MRKVRIYYTRVLNKNSTFSLNILDCRSLQNIYLIEPSLDYKVVPKFTQNPIWFFFKLTLKMLFHAFRLKIQEYFSRVDDSKY